MKLTRWPNGWKVDPKMTFEVKTTEPTRKLKIEPLIDAFDIRIYIPEGNLVHHYHVPYETLKAFEKEGDDE